MSIRVQNTFRGNERKCDFLESNSYNWALSPGNLQPSLVTDQIKPVYNEFG